MTGRSGSNRIGAARGLLACPTCAAPLTLGATFAMCAAGHSFDLARQGYLNLLGAKPPANADSADMVSARDRLLTSGLYEPIADAVARRLTSSAVIVEAGAGTGYYLAHALASNPDARGLALDVSVAAAKRAARAHGRMASVVADAWKTLPILSSRVGAVMCVFAPRNMAEFARILAPGGLLVVVTPTASHLDTLRERYGLLGIEADKDERLLRSASGLFEPIGRQRVDYTAPATADQVRDLIAMGPNAFHGVPDQVEDADVRVHVSVWIFRTPTP